MKTLVIHPEDPTTHFLKIIYENIDCTVVNHNCSKSLLKQQILEHDRIIMLGHGSPYGLMGFNRFVIDPTYVYLLREKVNSVFIWCNADMFVDRYQLKGFCSGMIISELEEAMYYSIYNPKHTEIEESNVLFSEAVKNVIQLKPEEMLNEMSKIYDHPKNRIIDFNKHNLFYR